MRFKRQPEDILKALGIYEPEDIDLDLIAFSLGAEVKRASLSDCEGNIIGTDTKAIITINNNVNLSRQRFSLGHELGHWINDRRKNLTYRCNTNDMGQFSIKKNNFRQNKEVRANQFSAKLMMPTHICLKYLRKQDITIETAKYLANEFQTSVTSAAIRLIEVSDQPCMLICWASDGKRRWFTRNSIIPDEIWPHERIMNLQNIPINLNGIEAEADKWISSDGAEDYMVVESLFNNGFDYLTLIWWKDESQLIKMV